MKNLLEGFKSKFEENSGGRKKSWSNLEDRSIEIILSEEKLKMNGTSETCGALSCILIRNQSEKEKKKRCERNTWRNNDQNLSNLKKYTHF